MHLYIVLAVLLAGVFIALYEFGIISLENTAIAVSVAVATLVICGALWFAEMRDGKVAVSTESDSLTSEQSTTDSVADTQYISDTAVDPDTEPVTDTEVYEDTKEIMDTDIVPAEDTEEITQKIPVVTEPPMPETTSAPTPVTVPPAPETTSAPAPETNPPVAADTETKAPVEDTKNVTTEEIPEAKPTVDYRAQARAAYEGLIIDATAYIQASPIGYSFECYPFERIDAYSGLTNVQKMYYDQLLDAINEFEPIIFSEAKMDVIEDVRTAADALFVMHPDIQCYVALEEYGSSDVRVKYFLPSDGTDVTDGDKSGILSEMAYFDAVCEYIVESMPKNISTYDKYRYLASVITLSTEYDHNYVYPHTNATAYGGIIDGHTVCVGYAVSFEYLCEKADLYCGRVEGKSYADNIHMWNLVKLDSGTYHVDVTWSDSGQNKPGDTKWMKYFILTQHQILTDHVISDGTVATGTGDLRDLDA